MDEILQTARENLGLDYNEFLRALDDAKAAGPNDERPTKKFEGPVNWFVRLTPNGRMRVLVSIPEMTPACSALVRGLLQWAGKHENDGLEVSVVVNGKTTDLTKAAAAQVTWDKQKAAIQKVFNPTGHVPTKEDKAFSRGYKAGYEAALAEFEASHDER